LLIIHLLKAPDEIKTLARKAQNNEELAVQDAKKLREWVMRCALQHGNSNLLANPMAHMQELQKTASQMEGLLNSINKYSKEVKRPL